MPLYFVGIDACLGDREALEERLAEWQAVPAYHGAWLLKADLNALDIRNALQAHLRDDDAAIVLELKPGSWWASEHVEPPGLAWLKANVLE